MASSTVELKSELRSYTNYGTNVLSMGELDDVVTRAERHIRSRKNVGANPDWFSEVQLEEALFWWSVVFAKDTVEGDSDIQIGAVDIGSVSTDDETPIWLDKAESALSAVDSGGDSGMGFGSTTVERENRVYGGDDTGGSGGDIGELGG